MIDQYPASLDVESALLSRLLVQPDQIGSLALGASDFYDPDHRDIWTAMQALHREGRPVDVTTLRAEMGRAVSLPVSSITAGHHAPLDEYADILRDLAFRRRYISELEAALRRAHAEDDPAVLMAALRDSAAGLSELVKPDDALGKINLEEHREEAEPPLLGILSPQGTTILYGDGGDGKGWVAARLASQLQRRVAILDFEMQPKEWAYRLDRFGVSLRDILYFSPGTTMDRWATDETARMLKAEGVEFLIIDSAMYASDVEDPYSPNGALAYGRARRRLNNLPALLLAHTTGGADKVFGSVFWRNEARIVWRLNKEYTSNRRHLECRKANGYSWLEGKKLNIEFSEERGVLNLHEHGKSWTPAT